MYELTLNKRCNAPVARVFAAWSSAEMIKRWFGPGTVTVTEVELTFRAAGEQTDFTLTHREFPTEDERDKHNQGWQGCLVKLAVFE